MPDNLEALSDLENLLAVDLSDRELIAARSLTATRIQVHGASRPGLTPFDLEVFAVVVARWVQAFGDGLDNLHVPTDDFDASSQSLASVIGKDPSQINRSLSNLVTAGLIHRSGDELSLHPALGALAEMLVPLLTRDLLDRQGRKLHHLAETYGEQLAYRLNEYRQARPRDLEAKTLESDLHSLRFGVPAAEFAATWATNPGAVYDWLGALTKLEEEVGIVVGPPEFHLAGELSELLSEKAFILRHFRQRKLEPANGA